MTHPEPRSAAPLTEATGASLELIALENTLFGSTVTTAGLLPGEAMLLALRDRHDLDVALIPGESVNDDGLFIDNLPISTLADSVPMRIRSSYDFADALAAVAA